MGLETGAVAAHPPRFHHHHHHHHPHFLSHHPYPHPPGSQDLHPHLAHPPCLKSPGGGSGGLPEGGGGGGEVLEEEFHPHPHQHHQHPHHLLPTSLCRDERSIKLEVQDLPPPPPQLPPPPPSSSSVVFNHPHHPFFQPHPHSHPHHVPPHDGLSPPSFPRLPSFAPHPGPHHPSLHHHPHHQQGPYDDFPPPPPPSLPPPSDRYKEQRIQDLSRGSELSPFSNNNNNNSCNNNSNSNNDGVNTTTFNDNPTSIERDDDSNNNNNNNSSNNNNNNNNSKLVNGYHELTQVNPHAHHHHPHHHHHHPPPHPHDPFPFPSDPDHHPPPSSRLGLPPGPPLPSEVPRSPPSLGTPGGGGSPQPVPPLSLPPPGGYLVGPPPPPMSPRGQQCERGLGDTPGLGSHPGGEGAEMGEQGMSPHEGGFEPHCNQRGGGGGSGGGGGGLPLGPGNGSSCRGGGGGGGGGGLEDPPGGCAGCGRRIVDRYYLQAVDKQWHVQCLTCSDCHFRLDSELTCFARDGQIFCKEDYYRRFAIKRCSRCQLGISANELVMRAREQVFHLSCFCCSACNRTLTPGEEFGLRDNLIYCRTDYELIFQGDYIPSLSPGMGLHHHPGHSPNPNGAVPFYNGVGAVQKGRPRKRKSPLPDGDGCTNLGLNGMDVGDRPGDVLDREGGYGHTPPRQKRVRTSFKHHQLRTMKSYFALNHNPDAKDLKQLAQKTGLSKRVLQVWFQNARAKYRRNLLKQQQDSDKPGSGAATSPSGADNKEGGKEGGGGSMTDMSNTRSPALSDISSTPSLCDLQSSAMDSGGDQSSSSITELFSSTIASIN